MPVDERARKFLLERSAYEWVVRRLEALDYGQNPEQLNPLLSALLYLAFKLAAAPSPPPELLVSLTGAFVNLLIDIAVDHVDDEDTGLLNLALQSIVRPRGGSASARSSDRCFFCSLPSTRSCARAAKGTSCQRYLA